MPTSVHTPGDAAEEQRVEVVEPLADADGLGPRLGDDEAADVPDEDEQDAEVEERRADAQQARLVELGRAGRPAELVVAVAPDGAADEARDAEVGQDAPQEGVHEWASRGRGRRDRLQRKEPRVVGLEPDGLGRVGTGHPDHLHDRSAVGRRLPGKGRAHGDDGGGIRTLLLLQGDPQQLEARAVVLEEATTGLGVDACRELEHHREVVGQLAVRVDDGSTAAVCRLEPSQHLAASAGVAVGPVGQVEGVLAAEVEGVDVGALETRPGRLRRGGRRDSPVAWRAGESPCSARASRIEGSAASELAVG